MAMDYLEILFTGMDVHHVMAVNETVQVKSVESEEEYRMNSEEQHLMVGQERRGDKNSPSRTEFKRSHLSKRM